MLRHWIEAAQREGRRVGVAVGGIAAEVNPDEIAPYVMAATVVGPADHEGVWWLYVESMLQGFGPMPQMYRENEIVGLWGPDVVGRVRPPLT